jgi:4-diphosphocytidyl-2-C-methyl-D-erythritol kinase
MLRERPGSGHPAALAVRAPAKVNLFLEVTARRPDGYHELRTLMVAVGLYDTLAFAPAPPGTIRLACSDPALGTGRENLVMRAAEALRRHTGHPGGATVRLTKRIPVAAGLGGGSSDAAATLVGLNRLWGLGLGRAELAALAAELGSDVAFFLGPPAAWCTGRGEEVTPWPLGGRLHVVLVCPPFGLSTAQVYRGVRVPEAPLDGAALKEAVRAGDVAAIGRHLHNRLQEPALALRPELAAWLARLAALGPAGCLVSGSGSTVFALCQDAADARRVAAAVRADETAAGARVFAVRSCV